MVITEIKQFINKAYDLNTDQIESCTNLYEIGLDSLEIVEVCVEMEIQFNLVIDADVTKIKTIRDIESYVLENLKNDNRARNQ